VGFEAGREKLMDEGADLVVVGAGMAGFCCAIEAARGGASVILLEKEAETGGSSRLSGGSFAFAGTDQQRAADIQDEAERLLDDLRRTGQGKSKEALLALFGQEQLETYRWLEAMGFRFGPPKIAAGQSAPRTHRADPVQAFALLEAAAVQTGRIRLLRQAAATRLCRTSHDAAVSGVLADHDGQPMHLHAARGVVLATGGFMRSPALLANFAPGQEGALPMGARGCTGDGLRMAWQFGADLCDMGFIKATFGIHRDAAPEDHHFLHSIYMGAIAVNLQGRRFVDESLPYKIVGDACLRQPGALGFQVFDQGVMQRSTADGSSFDLQSELRQGRLVEAPNLLALADRLEIDGAALVETVERYNAGAGIGADAEFGRTSLSSGWGRLCRLEQAPFYGYPTRSALVGTYCGLVVDGRMQVHDVFGAPIPHLFAAGHVTGGFHGAGYMTGTALSKAAVFGRVAGREAVRQGYSA
jgi:flavocytochrome c